MKKQTLTICYHVAQLEELGDMERQLIEKAILATQNAYAKYSHFHVGAACLLADGSMVIGANQENAAYPSGLCAERTAIFGAQANWPEQPIVALAIAAKNGQGIVENPVTPCGACRQVMLEIEDRYQCPMRVYLYGTSGILCFDSVKDLMPFSFVDASMR